MNGVTLGLYAEPALSGARAAARDAEPERERERHHRSSIFRSGRRRLRNFHTLHKRGVTMGRRESRGATEDPITFICVP